MHNPVVKICLALAGCICTALGIIGIFLPILPTTPFLLLAGFLFARSSERLMKKLEASKAYHTYVVPFKTKQGIERRIKARILGFSFTLMGISAFVIRNVEVWNIVVWAILLTITVWLLYLMKVRIPTIQPAKTPESDVQ